MRHRSRGFISVTRRGAADGASTARRRLRTVARCQLADTSPVTPGTCETGTATVPRRAQDGATRGRTDDDQACARLSALRAVGAQRRRICGPELTAVTT